VIVVEHDMDLVRKYCAHRDRFASGLCVGPKAPSNQIQSNKDVIEVYLGEEAAEDR